MEELIPERRKRNRGIRVGRLAKRMTHFLSYEIDQSDPKEFVQYCLKWCIELMERQGISTADEHIRYIIAFQRESNGAIKLNPFFEIPVSIYKSFRGDFISFVIKRKIALKNEQS